LIYLNIFAKKSITLAIDPRAYGNLYSASKRIAEAFNLFMGYLSKYHGSRPCYIAVLESRDSGNPHLYVAIFGIAV
jgi:hypothetical protein